MGSCTDPIGRTLVDRLRDAETPPSDLDVLDEAAAELERLTAELAHCGRENCMGWREGQVAMWVREERLLAANREIERLMVELAVCRNAIEDCLDVADNLPSDDDGDAAVRRTTLRRLNEAIGKATPRLLMERPEGQKIYGLRFRELRDAAEKARTALSKLIASGDPRVYADALRALDEALGEPRTGDRP